MFGKSRTIINGVELPEEFSGSSIINNVAISRDGKRYAAITRSRDLIMGEIPEDGRIEIDGTVIHYKKNQGVRIVGANVSILGGTVRITNSNYIGTAIDKAYEGIEMLSVNSNVTDIDLDLSNDDKVHVKGNGEEPRQNLEKLVINGFEGEISVPKSNSRLVLNIQNSVGNIQGDIAHRGAIKTSTGDIKIDLYAPLQVETRTSVGRVKVKGMISEGTDIYSPLQKPAAGTLHLQTSVGNITVRYML